MANSLVENSIGRLRPLAGSLMHALGTKLGLEISTNSHLWTWAMRHAAWIINRFSVTPGRGMTSFEMLANKPYTGKVCQFGEPVFAYQKTKSKGNAKWRRMICLGKVDPQDSFPLVQWGEPGPCALHKAHQHLLERASCFLSSTSSVPPMTSRVALEDVWCPQRAAERRLRLVSMCPQVK